jgi:8-oxo-dGTP diphosphatase
MLRTAPVDGLFDTLNTQTVTDLALNVNVSPAGIATIGWSGWVSAELLEGALRAAAEDLLAGRGLRRIELSLPANDLSARRAVLRAGFRLAGV